MSAAADSAHLCLDSEDAESFPLKEESVSVRPEFEKQKFQIHVDRCFNDLLLLHEPAVTCRGQSHKTFSYSNLQV